MNLLVTNSRTPQAFSIIQCLRPHARKIVVSMYGRSWLAARIGCAANSRLVDARYRVPYPTLDWQAGRIQPENTEAEEAYLQAIFRICEREQIDTIFPSLDAQVYIFSKNLHRLRERGILAPVPDYATLLGALDKYRTIQAAQASGFPHPRTCLADDDEAVARFAAEVKPPWVLRPRFSAGSVGLELVRDPALLPGRVRAVRARFGVPIVQEYIAGTDRQNFYLLLDGGGRVHFALCPRVLRCTQRIFRNATAACETASDHPLLPAASGLAAQLGWRGSLTIQTKIDPRTGQPCLMEANPRMGTHLWYRTAIGVNEPLLCLQIARGEQLEPVPRAPDGVLLLEPVEDAIGFGFEVLDWLLYRLRVGLLGRVPLDPASPPPSLRQLARDYARCYLNRRRKIASPIAAAWWKDPLVTLAWAYTVFRAWTLAWSRLGR